MIADRLWRWMRGGRTDLAPDPSTPEERAGALLCEHLTPEQRASLRAHGFFAVRGSLGGRYTIRYGGAKSIAGGDARVGIAGTVYCLQATTPMPDADVSLAQMLLIQTNEATFLGTANRSYGPAAYVHSVILRQRDWPTRRPSWLA